MGALLPSSRRAEGKYLLTGAHGSSQVFLIDFGFGKFNPRPQECAYEVDQLRRLFGAAASPAPPPLPHP